MSLRNLSLAFVLAALGGIASAQTYPPPAPPLPAPMLAIPVLEADLKAKAGSNIVRFGRDSWVLDQSARTTLAAQAAWLRMHPFVRASIEGHADGRLTRDHALALAERRATAVRNFLVASGVPPWQLSVVSWGKERPEVGAAHDATWLQNSRAVTVLKQPPQQFLPPPPPQPVGQD